MRSLRLVNQEQTVGEFSIAKHGTPKMINGEEGIVNVQKFKMEVPLATTQEYLLKGFDGLIPKITVESEATPILKLPDGRRTDLEDVFTKRVTTESFVRQEDGETYLTVVCRFLLLAQFTVTNVVNICNVFMAPAEEERDTLGETTNADPEKEQKVVNAKSLIELGNLDDNSDFDTSDAEADMIAEKRIPYKTKEHNISACHGDVSCITQTEAETETEAAAPALVAQPIIAAKPLDAMSSIDSAYGSLADSVSQVMSDFESITFDSSDTEIEDDHLFIFDDEGIATDDDHATNKFKI